MYVQNILLGSSVPNSGKHSEGEWDKVLCMEQGIMKNKRKSNTLKKVIYLILAVYVGYILFQQQMYLLACEKEENYYQCEINKQKEINEQYKKQEQYYRTDSYIEKIAREKLGMVLPEERVFIDISK